jgi:hypothetical protein
LVDGKVVFGTGEVNRRDEPEQAIIRLFKSDFARNIFFTFHLDKAASLRIPLFDQLAFHFLNFIMAISSLQEKIRKAYKEECIKKDKEIIELKTCSWKVQKEARRIIL